MFYFGFDRVSGSAVYDDSGSGNNGELTSLATVTKTSGTCGNGLKLHGGESSANKMGNAGSPYPRNCCVQSTDLESAMGTLCDFK